METFSALLALCAGNSPVPVNSPHKGQWRGALIFSLICARINDWVNYHEAGDLRRHRGHYDVSVMERGKHIIVWYIPWYNMVTSWYEHTCYWPFVSRFHWYRGIPDTKGQWKEIVIILSLVLIRFWTSSQVSVMLRSSPFFLHKPTWTYQWLNEI